MPTWRRFAAGLRLTACICVVAWPMVGRVLAQDDDGMPKDQSSWVLAYALVVLGIVLGLVAVCRPGNRSAEVRIDDE